MTITVQVRDRTRRLLGEVTDVRLFTAALRFARVSAWTLELDDSSLGADLLTEGDGIYVTRDDAVLLSGPIRVRQRKLENGRRTLTVGGVDDTAYLETRLALPVPGGPPYTTAQYDTITAAAQTAMIYYINRNLGAGAVLNRRLPGLTFATDLGLGTSVRGNARFHNLLEVVQGLALDGGDLGFRLTQVGTDIEFQVYDPADLTATAVFSEELGNLAGFDYSVAEPTASYVYVGGQGEGTARTIVEGGTAVAQDRVEVFADRRDTNDNTTLELARDSRLVEGQSLTALSLSTIDTDAVAFGVDYNLGDRVRVIVDGTQIDDVLREVTLMWSAADDERLTPVVGTPGATNPLIPALFADQRQIARRVAQLERQ